MRTKCEIQPLPRTKLTEKCSACGAQEFRGLWLTANEATTTTAREFGIDPSFPGNKQFLMTLTYRLMLTARAYKEML